MEYLKDPVSIDYGLKYWWECIAQMWFRKMEKQKRRYWRGVESLVKGEAPYHSWSYTQDTLSYHKDMDSTMFIAALFVTARTCKQPRCPSAEEWIKKVWYIYTVEY